MYSKDCHVDHCFILAAHNKDEYLVEDLSGMKKYNVLRKQVYRRGYLKGMPSQEKQYFQKLLKLAPNTKVTIILRPEKSRIIETMARIEEEILR